MGTKQPENPRHTLRVPLEMRVHATGADGVETLLMSHDWSSSGVFLRTRHPFAVGATTRLSVLLPGARAPVALEAVVTRQVLETDATHDRPPGMALRFHSVPGPLQTYLTDAVRQRAVLNPDEILSSQAVVLVVGGDRPERLRYALFLDTHGFDVSVADSVSETMELLEKGLDPVAFVIIDDVNGTLSTTLQRHMMRRTVHHMPRAVVLLGEPHGGFEGQLKHAMETLPRHTDPVAVKYAIDQQMASPPLLPDPLSATDGG